MARPAGGDSIDQVRGSVWLLAAALVLVGLALLLLVRPLLLGGPPSEGVADALRVAAAPARDGSHGGERRQAGAPEGGDTRPAKPVPRAAQPPPQAAPAPAANAPATDPSADAGEGDGEEPRGIALFPPPGTDPPKPGIVVPEDFELPPGYVRHHQVTDDGQQLPPILMFHPDFDWVDANGRKITLPADNVVPPDLAPPGMPIRMLEVPDTHVEFVEQPPPGADAEPADPEP